MRKSAWTCPDSHPLIIFVPGQAYVPATTKVRGNDKNSYFHAQYQRILVRRGKKKAIVAVAHSMLIAIYHVLSGNAFVDLGSDYYNQFGTEKKSTAYLSKLKKLGWEPPASVAVS